MHENFAGPQYSNDPQQGTSASAPATSYPFFPSGPPQSTAIGPTTFPPNAQGILPPRSNPVAPNNAYLPPVSSCQNCYPPGQPGPYKSAQGRPQTTIPPANHGQSLPN